MPSAESSAAAASALSAIRSATITAAPASPSARAQAAPMPCPPPVTTPTRPSSLSFSRYVVSVLSAHPVSAVDVVGLRDDVIALGAGEEDRHAGQVLRAAHAPVRHGLADEPLLLAQRAVLI